MIDAIDEFVFNCNYANSSNSNANGSKRQLQQACKEPCHTLATLNELYLQNRVKFFKYVYM